MPSLVVHHEVDDVQHWLSSSKRDEFFGTLGVTNIKTYTDPQNANRVALSLDAPDIDALVGSLQTPEAADAMKHDGVRPETVVLLIEA